MTPDLTAAGTELTEISRQMRELEDELENFRIAATPNVGYSEITYAQHRDIKAPELDIDTYRGDTSLQNYLQWFINNKDLPFNLINNNIKKSLPSLVLHRLNQQHPEDCRTMNQVIRFLLREHGSTQELEPQLQKYHLDIGSLNNMVMSGNDYSIIPAKCKEAQTNADKHLVGLRGIFTLKEMCNTYLGSTDTKMWFQEALLSHTNTSWLANNILTISQINVLSASRLATGEDKLKTLLKRWKIFGTVQII